MTRPGEERPGEERPGPYPHSVKNLQREIRRLNALVDQLRDRNDAHLRELTTPWPELPNGEGVADPTGLTASEVEQGRESPPGCDPND